MASGTVGIIANPASGKDIRRLVAHASVFDNQEKRSIVRRAILGAVAAGAERFVYMPDPHLIVEQAFEDLHLDVPFEPVESPQTGSALDTTRSAALMRDSGVDVLITLGGDGTNRAVVLGWRHAPLVPISTGTNNVFPRMGEATVAGAAAGAVASGAMALDEVARQAKVVEVEIDAESPDVALIDAVLHEGLFVGAKALWKSSALRTLVLARAEPAAVGISAIGGLLQPVSSADDHGLVLHIGEGGPILYAPIAPGLYDGVHLRDYRPLPFGEVVEVHGPGVLAFDGERERILHDGQSARMRVVRDGPWVIDVPLAMSRAGCRGLFRLQPEESDGD